MDGSCCYNIRVERWTLLILPDAQVLSGRRRTFSKVDLISGYNHGIGWVGRRMEDGLQHKGGPVWVARDAVRSHPCTHRVPLCNWWMRYWDHRGGKFRIPEWSFSFRSEEDLNRNLWEFLDKVVCQLGKGRGWSTISWETRIPTGLVDPGRDWR